MALKSMHTKFKYWGYVCITMIGIFEQLQEGVSTYRRRHYWVLDAQTIKGPV